MSEQTGTAGTSSAAADDRSSAQIEAQDPASPTVRTAVEIKTNAGGLDVLATVYAFAMALGLTQVFLGSREFFTRVQDGTVGVVDEKTLLIFLLFANIALLGLRFFWVPRNLQSLVIAAAKFHAIAPDAERAKGDLSNLAIAFHLIIIFLHGTLFYLICAEFEYVVFAVSSNLPLSSSIFAGYVAMHSALLLMNSAWIALARRQEIRLERAASDHEAAEQPAAGNVWWRNNLVAGLAALAPFAIVGTCKSVETACVREAVQTEANLIDLLPTSPHMFATIYYDAVAVLGSLGVQSEHFAVWWVLIVFAVNSAYDLLNAGRFYVFFRDVEWKDTVASERSRAPIS
ncbi:MAG: hypothetical protein AAFQ42_02385 [Pseudomonadota bacterium]